MEGRKRSIRLPIERPDDETWQELRVLGTQAARHKNRRLAGEYVIKSKVLDDVAALLALDEDQNKALAKELQRRLYIDENDSLSKWVRDDAHQRCRDYWRAKGKLVLRGSERLACYSADRALSIRATGTKDGVLFEWDGETPVLVCRFRPAKTHDPIRLRVALESSAARKDWYIREAVAAIWEGRWKPGRVTIRFDRMAHTIDAMISVTIPGEEVTAGENHATLGPLDEHGQLWLRTDAGANYDFSDRVHRMAHMKEHMEGIKRRIRATAGHGKGRRRVKRDLLARQSFQDWVEGPLHQLSAAIIEACEASDVGTLTVMGLSDGDLPWAELVFQLQYKGEDAGIMVTDEEASTSSAVRARARKVRKDQQEIKGARDGLSKISKALKRKNRQEPNDD